MIHEPECWDMGVCICVMLRAAYKRGRQDAAQDVAAYADSEYMLIKSWDVAVAAARGEDTYKPAAIVGTNGNGVNGAAARGEDSDVWDRIAEAEYDEEIDHILNSDLGGGEDTGHE